ncbi:MAG: hypothetical protein QOG95_5546 [Mycobacterium sp.]|nr:hypothetical protein [Mycobacterium sp.]
MRTLDIATYTSPLPSRWRAQTDHRHPRPPGATIGLMGALVIGLAITRYVLVNPPIAGLGREETQPLGRPVIKQLLVGPAPA